MENGDDVKMKELVRDGARPPRVLEAASGRPIYREREE
jgi:hypothetical protein